MRIRIHICPQLVSIRSESIVGNWDAGFVGCLWTIVNHCVVAKFKCALRVVALNWTINQISDVGFSTVNIHNYTKFQFLHFFFIFFVCALSREERDEYDWGMSAAPRWWRGARRTTRSRHVERNGISNAQGRFARSHRMLSARWKNTAHVWDARWFQRHGVGPPLTSICFYFASCNFWRSFTIPCSMFLLWNCDLLFAKI